MNNRSKKLIALVLALGMNYAGLSAVGRTAAMYNDIETSPENMFAAGVLDFTALPSSFEYDIDAGEQVHFSVDFDKASSSVPFGQSGHFEWLTVEDRTLCSAMELILVASASSSASELYRGPLLDFSYATTSALGALEFEIIATTTRSAIEYGEKCKFKLVFGAGQTPELSGGGFFDIEEVRGILNAENHRVVLNEFLPNPQGVEYGFDFGEDHDDMPQGEWVELYNNGDVPRDLSGWYVWDDSAADDHKIFITAANTSSATTTIAAHGWLVVYMNRAILNNGGDTVMLYDSAENLLDSHTYTTNADFCDMEPTPDSANDTTGSGSCSVPKNKSFARIPDGVGEWVDPIPTPGEPNIADETVLADASEPDTVPADIVAAVPEETLVTEGGLSATTMEASESTDDTATTTISEESEFEEEEATGTADAVVIFKVPENKEEKMEESPAVVPAEEATAIDGPIMYARETEMVISEEAGEPEN